MNKRILLYDIELSPDIVYTWPGKMYDQTIIKVIKHWEILSIAYKWLGEKEVHCISKQNCIDDQVMMKRFWHILNEADIVIAHNGIDFDNKKVRARYLKHGIAPFSPFKSIDTLKFSRSTFGLTSHRLNDLAEYLDLGSKIKHNGFDMWEDVMANKAAAWTKMREYNKHDVVLLEKVYLKLRPWMDKHPHIATDSIAACTACGSSHLQRRGWGINDQGKYARVQCMSCGHWCREKAIEEKSKNTIKNIG